MDIDLVSLRNERFLACSFEPPVLALVALLRSPAALAWGPDSSLAIPAPIDFDSYLHSLLRLAAPPPNVHAPGNIAAQPPGAEAAPQVRGYCTSCPGC